jgi:hypothetical protein
MTTCYPLGTLRTYLDGELTADESVALATHLTDCDLCQTQLDDLATLRARVGHAFAVDVPAGVPMDAAWARVQAQLSPASASAATPSRGARVLTLSSRRKRVALGTAAAAALLLVALLVPSVRAAADQLLQIFRAQSVVYVSVSPSRLRQIEQLQGNPNALFLSQPTAVGTPPQVQQAGSLPQAQALVGFAPQAPTILPGGVQSSAIEVRGQSEYRVQVNVQTVRQVLMALGVTDVRVPDALGAQPITITLPPVAHLQYVGADYTLNLIEGTSPTVSLPAGVDLSQLGKAVLEVYGMAPQQADAMSKQIDWSSTLAFPFPVGTSQLQQVNVAGTTGILLDAQANGILRHSSSQQAGSSPSTSGAQTNGQWQGVVYWQRGGHFYILTGEGNGIGNSALLSAASSLR